MPSPKPLPSLEVLRQLLAYDPETGILMWQVGRRGKARVGSPAGSLAGGRGYLRVRIGSHCFKAHRVVWYLHHGVDPGPLLVDHVNRDRSDNRICNLRLVDAKGNRANSLDNSRAVQVTYPDGSSCQLPSVKAAARFLGCHHKTVQRYLQGVHKHPEGLRVAYA